MADILSMTKAKIVRMEDDSGLKGTSVLWRLSIFLCFISLVMYTVGVSTSKWVGFDHEQFDPDLDDPTYFQKPNVEVELHYGLWRKCAVYIVDDHVLYDDCQDMDNNDNWKPAAKVLCSLGLVLGLFGLIAAVWAGWAQSNNMVGAAGTTVILAGICGAIGSATFVGKAKDLDERFEPHFSVYMSFIGCALLILGGGLQLLSIQTSYSTIA